MSTRFLLTALAVLTLSGVAHAETHSDFNKQVDLSSMKTFEFKAQRRFSKDPVADNPIWADQLRMAIRSDFAAHGIKEVSGGNPDFFVAFYVGLKDRYDVRYVDYGFPLWHRGLRGAWGWPPAYDTWAVPYTQSTLIIDVIDARTNQLVWRGYDKDAIDLKKTEKDFGKAVESVLKRFYRDSRQSS
ncbi:hypothetical protein TBR22_A42800 [Luteitalea sp. TBR-22]|uniref:DUF4136 domain-containing protein n=1 Tax=Luteitalea sp. TBR-22 TaxID=2802971 RepID=UPI001AF27E93|nr:DUF4136 domain-containing protein [Luteitalea sp. TBR-22]BCS35054.1 hypothetical protein TBR22_A42800 [Luteitalea sp. TBR-22]